MVSFGWNCLGDCDSGEGVLLIEALMAEEYGDDGRIYNSVRCNEAGEMIASGLKGGRGKSSLSYWGIGNLGG